MTPEERKQFESIFDPSESGTINQEYVNDVLNHFIDIQHLLDDSLSIEYEGYMYKCDDLSLYRAENNKLNVCPYFKLENNPNRKTRLLINEVANIVMQSSNKTTNHSKTTSIYYRGFNPRGLIGTDESVLVPFLLEISPSETLCYPDAYAWFASLSYSKSISGE